jgi:hypothetical protein
MCNSSAGFEYQTASTDDVYLCTCNANHRVLLPLLRFRPTHEAAVASFYAHIITPGNSTAIGLTPRMFSGLVLALEKSPRRDVYRSSVVRVEHHLATPRTGIAPALSGRFAPLH